MMKKRSIVTRLAAVLALIMLMTAFAGCGSSKDKESAQDSTSVQESTTEQESTSSEQEQPAQETVPEEKEPEAEPVSETPESVQEAAAEPEPAPVQEPAPAQEPVPAQQEPAAQNPAQEIPAGLWPDGKFALNGVSYQLPIPQQTLVDAGWTIRFENTQNTEAFKIQPGEVMNAELSLAGFENAVIVTAEFENMGKEAILLSECPLTALYISAAKGAQPAAAETGAETEGETAETAAEGAEAPAEQETILLPELKFESNITWGSSAEEITAVYGEPTFSGSGSNRFDCMYENKYFYLEFLGEPDKGMRQMIYCVN